MINYDNLWVMMKTNDMTKTDLRKASNMSSSTFAKLSKNEEVSLDVLIRLCQVFNCQLSDVCHIEYVEGDEFI